MLGWVHNYQWQVDKILSKSPQMTICISKATNENQTKTKQKPHHWHYSLREKKISIKTIKKIKSKMTKEVINERKAIQSIFLFKGLFIHAVERHLQVD